MRVFKFGGASIATPERIQNVAGIISDYADQPLLVVVSALGKTTNALEKVAEAFFKGDKQTAKQLFTALEEQHNEYARKMLGGDAPATLEKLTEFYTEIEWVISGPIEKPYDYYYDQIVCIGELLSTCILSAYLNANGRPNTWIDVRDVFRTDETYRDARIDWNFTQNKVNEIVKPALEATGMVLTQGFIGATDQNASTTLGREGSDYSAAVFANMLDAESQTIWKDVEGLLNADPKLFPNTVKIEEITYYEVIEMAFYGAQVIHPKTIKPLQNKQIPLFVKCFLDKTLKGTMIKEQTDTFVYPPIIVLKKDQALLQVTSKDFSFITEDNLSNLYNIFHGLNIKINLIQNAAISLVVCIDNKPDVVEQLMEVLSKDYKVLRNEDVQLLTVRHFTPSILEELTKGRVALLEQKSRNTVQMVIK